MITKPSLSIFISSPSDLSHERLIAKKVVSDINATGLVNHCDLKCFLYEDTIPAVVGQLPQFTIDNYMIHPKDADIFVCFLWSKMGTPLVDPKTGTKYHSGTEYEFIHAYQSYREQGHPHILLYKCIRPAVLDDVDFQQAENVRSFFKSFEGINNTFDGFYKTYESEHDFEKILFRDLLIILQRHFPPQLPEVSTSKAPDDRIALSISLDELRKRCYEINAELRNYSTQLAGQYEIPRIEATQIVDWILVNEDHKRLSMLIDKPGGGKTVVMAQILKQLETRGMTVMALKCDYLSGIRSRTELQERLGLPASIEVCIRHLASEGPVVVLVDQLDALSIALSQDFSTLDHIYSLLLKLIDIEHVRVVVSCREFDLHFDPKLSSLDRQRYTTFMLSSLTRDQIDEAIRSIGLEGRITPSQRIYQLLIVPLHLSIFVRLFANQETSIFSEEIHNLQQLYDCLWDRYITTSLVPNLSEAIDALVDTMQNMRQLTAPVGVLDPEPYRRAAVHLQRVHFIHKEKGSFVFFHQTLYDYCYARRFVAQGRSISQELSESAQGLFERAQMVQILVYMRTVNLDKYIEEIHTLLFAMYLRVHLRILLIEWFASIPDPLPAEYTIVRRLIEDAQDRDDFLRAARGNAGWFDVLNRGFLATLLAQEDGGQIKISTVQYLSSLMNRRTSEVLALIVPYQGHDSDWDYIIMQCLASLKDWREDE